MCIKPVSYRDVCRKTDLGVPASFCMCRFLQRESGHPACGRVAWVARRMDAVP